MQTITSYQSIIELIERFPLTTSFVDWLSQGNYEFDVLKETHSPTEYNRTIQFRAKGELIQIAKINLSIPIIGYDFIQGLLQSKSPFGKYVAEHPEAGITKVWVSNTQTETQYVIASNICREGKVCGTCWEAYESENVKSLLQQR